MSKRVRFIILLICVALFLSITPVIIGYSLGYRIDFEQKRIVATGGIYLRVWPSPADVYVDLKLKEKTSLITNSIFTQNLLPKNHLISVKKEGYFDYQKTLPVKESKVTKLEHITLFKKQVAFRPLTSASTSPFLNMPKLPTALSKTATIFDISQNNIYYVSKNNLLYRADSSGKNSTQIFDSFYSPIKNIRISPDQSKILYCNDYEIMYSWISDKTFNKNFLNRFSEKIGQCYWLNNDYVVFTLGKKIKISEIDTTGDQINIIELPQQADKIYFSQ